MLYLLLMLPFVVVPTLAAWLLAGKTADSARRQQWAMLAAGAPARVNQVQSARAFLGLARLALDDGLGVVRTSAALSGAGEQLEMLVHARRVRGATLAWRVSAAVHAVGFAPRVVAWLLMQRIRHRGAAARLQSSPSDPLDALIAVLDPLLRDGESETP